MNAVRRLRSQTGVTQQMLASRAGTSQPTIALYEAGVKSPTLATVQRHEFEHTIRSAGRRSEKPPFFSGSVGNKICGY